MGALFIFKLSEEIKIKSLDQIFRISQEIAKMFGPEFHATCLRIPIKKTRLCLQCMRLSAQSTSISNHLGDSKTLQCHTSSYVLNSTLCKCLLPTSFIMQLYFINCTLFIPTTSLHLHYRITI